MLKWWRGETNPTNLRAGVWVTLPDGITPAPMATVFAAGEVKIRWANAIAWVDILGSFTNTGIDGHWIYEGDPTEANTDGNHIEINVVKPYVPIPGMFHYGRTSIGLEQPDRVAQAVWNVLVSQIGGISGALAELILRPSGAIVADGLNSTTTFKTNLPAGDSQAHRSAWCCFLDGALAGQVQKVIAYDGVTKFLSFNVPFTQTPVAATRFMLVNK